MMMTFSQHEFMAIVIAELVVVMLTFAWIGIVIGRREGRVLQLKDVQLKDSKGHFPGAYSHCEPMDGRRAETTIEGDAQAEGAAAESQGLSLPYTEGELAVLRTRPDGHCDHVQRARFIATIDELQRRSGHATVQVVDDL